MTELRNNITTASPQQAPANVRKLTTGTLELKTVSATLLRLHSLESAEHLTNSMAGTGIALPLQTGQSIGQEPAVLCLRPNDWLLFGETIDSAELEKRLSLVVNAAETTLIDNSDGLATFRLSGPGAPWLLSKLSGLDYLAGLRQGQHCTRTRMARVAVVVHYHQPEGDQFSFDLIFDRSIAKYLWELLSAGTDHAGELASAYGDAL